MPNHSKLYAYGMLSGQPLEIGPKEVIFNSKKINGFGLYYFLE